MCENLKHFDMTALTKNLISQQNRFEDYAKEVIADREHILVYHNLGYQTRLNAYINILCDDNQLSDQDRSVLHTARWIYGIAEAQNKMTEIDFEQGKKIVLSVLQELSAEFNFLPVFRSKLATVLSTLTPYDRSNSKLERVFKDAMLMDFAGANGKAHLKLLYEELILRNYKLGKLSFYDIALNYMNMVMPETSYGREHIAPALKDLKTDLEKEKNQISKKRKKALKKQLNIDDGEIKELKKNLKATKGRDERGIQTLFRTTIKNHYTLNEMVDRKANIMITVNSIILSLALGGILTAELSAINLGSLPIAIFVICSGVSVFYAILSIRPNKTQGNFSEAEIRSKQGNLLYFGNFHNMEFRDFEWAFLEMLNDKNYMYGAMINDYYHLGAGLNKKYKRIRLSLNVFLAGFIVALVLQLIVQFGI